jgi:hypothetical protein
MYGHRENLDRRRWRDRQKGKTMPRFIIETTSGDQRQHEYEARDEAEALRHFISHQFPIPELLAERDEDNYKGWKKIEISIGPGVCDECFEPSPNTKICTDCAEDKLHAEQEENDG